MKEDIGMQDVYYTEVNNTKRSNPIKEEYSYQEYVWRTSQKMHLWNVSCTCVTGCPGWAVGGMCWGSVESREIWAHNTHCETRHSHLWETAWVWGKKHCYADWGDVLIFLCQVPVAQFFSFTTPSSITKLLESTSILWPGMKGYSYGWWGHYQSLWKEPWSISLSLLSYSTPFSSRPLHVKEKTQTTSRDQNIIYS